MEQLIPIANKLQDVLGAIGCNTTTNTTSSNNNSNTINLPQIIVVGGQSSGKSSVLESIVGRSFLPRGTGIVTRRPLILQLYNTSSSTSSSSSSNTSSSKQHRNGKSSSASSSSSGGHEHGGAPPAQNRDDEDQLNEEWGEFLHQRGRKYYNFNEIRQEIIMETNRLTGNNKGIHNEPIHLKIYSKYVLSLTLIDLPGIAKVPVGDQPQNIESQIRNMILQYITNPNAIILAVTPANTDLANSDAIQLAQQVDPMGIRTVGVLTKVDLMDPGTDCSDILMNLVIPLHRGYIAVVNRGQKDIDADKSIRDGLKKEEHFFKKHVVYSKDPNILTKCGTYRLAKTLNSILMNHIRDCLPDIKSRISLLLNDVQHEMEALGPIGGSAGSIPNTKSGRGTAVLQILSKFANNFASLLDGKGCKDYDLCKLSSTSMSSSSTTLYGSNMHHQSNMKNNATISNELEGGARISYIFTDIFASSLVSVGAFDALSDDEIRATIRNANGTRPALFVPEISFDILVRRQISRLEQPGIQCVDLVYDELHRIALQSQPNELIRYPVLRERIVEVMSTLLRKSLVPTQMMISNLIKIELSYINTSHPDFIGGSRAVAKLMERIGQDNDQQKKRDQASFIAQTTGTATPALTTATANLKVEQKETKSPLSDHQSDMENAPSIVQQSSSSEMYENQSNNNNSSLFNYIFRPNAPMEDTTTLTNNSKFTPSPTTATNSKYQDHMEKQKKRRESLVGGPPLSVVHLPSVPDKMNESTSMPPTDRERVEMEVIKSLVESYFIIIRKNFIDMVPKTIMYFLVNHIRDTIQNDLVSELYRDDEIGYLLKEADDIAIRRQTCTETKELLCTALEIVNEVRDYNTFQ